MGEPEPARCWLVGVIQLCCMAALVDCSARQEWHRRVVPMLSIQKGARLRGARTCAVLAGGGDPALLHSRPSGLLRSTRVAQKSRANVNTTYQFKKVRGS